MFAPDPAPSPDLIVTLKYVRFVGSTSSSSRSSRESRDDRDSLPKCDSSHLLVSCLRVSSSLSKSSGFFVSASSRSFSTGTTPPPGRCSRFGGPPLPAFAGCPPPSAKSFGWRPSRRALRNRSDRLSQSESSPAPGASLPPRPPSFSICVCSAAYRISCPITVPSGATRSTCCSSRCFSSGSSSSYSSSCWRVCSFSVTSVPSGLVSCRMSVSSLSMTFRELTDCCTSSGPVGTSSVRAFSDSSSSRISSTPLLIALSNDSKRLQTTPRRHQDVEPSCPFRARAPNNTETAETKPSCAREPDPSQRQPASQPASLRCGRVDGCNGGGGGGSEAR
uniref:Uncharacterized protein n=1 Tax=Anopheles farauti TaxID=69004 RepID=A0A182QSP2_9DIPT